jgi:ribonuclease-3
LLGRGEDRSGGRAKKGLLGDALEALIAAIYLDGGIGEARNFVRRHITADLDSGPPDEVLPAADYKGALQERAQAKGLPPPRYTVIKERGPEHAKLFLIEASVGTELKTRAEAHSKKSASQQAARLLLEQL